MRSGYPSTAAFNQTTFDGSAHGLAGIVARAASRLVGLALLAAAAFAVASLATWNVADPSFSHATDAMPKNAMGYPGAVFADLAMQFFGLASVAGLAPGVIWGMLLASGRGVDRLPRRGAAWLGCAIAAAGIAGCLPAPESWPLPAGLGGVVGDVVLALPRWLLGGYPSGMSGVFVGLIIAVPGSWLFLFGSGLAGRRMPLKARQLEIRDEDDEFDDEGESGGMLALGALTHSWLSIRAFLRRSFGRPHQAPLQRPWRNIPMEEDDEAFWPEAAPRAVPAGRDRVEPEFGGSFDGDDVPFDLDEDADDAPYAGPAATRSGPAAAAARIDSPAPRPRPGVRIQREAQASLLASGRFEMPSLHFLAEPK